MSRLFEAPNPQEFPFEGQKRVGSPNWAGREVDKVIYRTEVFSDGRQYVGVCPELRIRETGHSPDEAVGRLQKAVEAYLQECKDQDILGIVLEELVFNEIAGVWKLRERSTHIQVAVVNLDERIHDVEHAVTPRSLNHTPCK